MDFRDTPEEAEYRRSLAEWLAGYVSGHRMDEVDQRQWHRALYDAGYIAQTWAKEEGGQGLPPIYDVILNEEVARAGARPAPANPNYLGRAIFRFGTDAQKERFLKPTLSGETQWCQGFSEPGAGSDLASMRTSARLDGDSWIINGQKLWTSGAHEADWCFLLARSEPGASKHKGISVFLIDMRTQGVTVRPIRTTDGLEHTCETFWDDVRIPADRLLGERGQGWNIAMWALSFERGPADIGVVPPLLRSLSRLEAKARAAGLDRFEHVRHALTKAYVMVQVLHLESIRQVSLREAGRPAGAEGPVAKMLWAHADQAVGHAWLDVLGPLALTGADGGATVSTYFHSRPASVYGGSIQIQRNLLSQRFMGMPRPGK